MAPRAEQRVLAARSSQVIAATTAVTLSQASAAIFATATGNIIGTLVDDSSTRTFPVVSGMIYPLSFISFDVSSAVGCIALFNINE
jgi:hypothetical protein